MCLRKQIEQGGIEANSVRRIGDVDQAAIDVEKIRPIDARRRWRCSIA
jgi:hypothetical protein